MENKRDVRRKILLSLAMLAAFTAASLAILTYTGLWKAEASFEAGVISWTLSKMGIHSAASGNNIITTAGGELALIKITESCASIGVIFGFFGLVLITPIPLKIKSIATAIALPLVFLGNVARILIIMIVGYWLGTGALIIVHDWMGTAMTFAFILAAYGLWVWVVGKFIEGKEKKQELVKGPGQLNP